MYKNKAAWAFRYPRYGDISASPKYGFSPPMRINSSPYSKGVWTVKILTKSAFYYNIYKDIYVFFKNTVRVCGKLNIINTHLI